LTGLAKIGICGNCRRRYKCKWWKTAKKMEDDPLVFVRGHKYNFMVMEGDEPRDIPALVYDGQIVMCCYYYKE